MDLQAQRRQLVAMLEQLTQGSEDSKKSLRDYSHELTVFDNHPADVATEDYLRNLDATLRENDSSIADMVQNALTRIDRGEYQHCSQCGREIEPQRLQALPYVHTCTACANSSELGGQGKPPTSPQFPEDATWPKFNQYGTSDSIQDQPSQVRDRQD